MELYLAIVSYLVFVVVVTAILYLKLTIRVWSAFNMALIFGIVWLTVVYPPTDLIKEQEPVMIMVYLVIMTLTPVVLVIYALTKGLFDYRHR